MFFSERELKKALREQSAMDSYRQRSRDHLIFSCIFSCYGKLGHQIAKLVTIVVKTYFPRCIPNEK